MVVWLFLVIQRSKCCIFTCHPVVTPIISIPELSSTQLFVSVYRFCLHKLELMIVHSVSEQVKAECCCVHMALRFPHFTILDPEIMY